MRETINKIRLLLDRKDKFSLAGVAILMMFASLLEMAGVGVLVAVVTLILVPETVASHGVLRDAAVLLNQLSDKYGVYSILGATALLFVLKTVFSYLIVKVSALFVYGKQRDLAVRLYSNFLKGDYAALTARPVAELDVNIHYCSLLSPYVFMPAAQLAGDILTIIILGAFLTVSMPLITISGITFMVLVGAVIQLATSRRNRVEGEKFAASETENSVIRLTGLNNANYIKSVLAEDYFTSIYRKSECESNSSGSMIYTIGQLPRFTLECAAVLLMLGVFSVMLWKGVPKPQILAAFTAIVAVMARILPALSRCHYNIMRIKQSKSIFDRISDDLTGFPQEQEAADQSADPQLNNALVLDNVSYFHAGSNRATPCNLSLEIPAFSSCGIAGKTGCGKSTLIEILLGLRTPSNGTVKADGVDIFTNVRAWRRQIGYVPQTIHLVPGTLRENVAFGVPRENIDDSKVLNALKLAQLEEFDLDRVISADGNNLSGGQKQRIGIARALYRDVKLLILDEATSNLDKNTEEAFVSALDNLQGKLTLIVIAHRENTIEKCDKVINLTNQE